MSINYSTLNKIRSMSNYGFYITGNTVDPIYSKGWISSTPNISIQGSSVYIDYSHTYDTSDLTYLRKIFGTTGITCSFSEVNYFDDNKNIKTKIGGTIQIQKTLNGNKIIIGSIISGFTSSNTYNYYLKENFLSTPEITRQASGSYTGYFLVNSLPKLSLSTFKTLGLLGQDLGYEEYIELAGACGENQGRLQVKSICTLKDNTELLYFSAGVTAQDFSQKLTTLDVYMRGDTEKLVAPGGSNLTGIFLTRNTSSNSIINCSEYQTQDQAIMRQDFINLDPSIINVSSYFINCKSCYDLVYGYDSGIVLDTQVGESFNSLIFIKVEENTSSIIPSVNLFLSTTNNTVFIPSNTENVVKIDLSHPSLLKYDMFLYTEVTRSVLINTPDFVKYGEIGYNNSYAILKNYGKNRTIYGTLKGPNTINFSFNV